MLILRYSLQGINMAHIGKIGEFKENTESFANYVERLEQFFAANEVKDE